MSTTQALQQIASKFLAQAITEVFPGALLIEGSYSNVLFHYDAMLPQKIDETMICLVEEKMRGLIKSDPEFRLTEMMRQNAAEYFLYHEQPLIADRIEELEDTLVPIVQIGNFKDYCVPDDLPTELSLFFFEVLSMDHQAVDNQWITHFTGTAHFAKDALKAFVKRFRAARKLDHRKIGKELGLFTPIDTDLWGCLPRGEQLKNTLMQVKLNSIAVQTPLELTPELLGFTAKRWFDPTAAWHAWLFARSGETSLRLTEFTQKIDSARSSQLCGLIRNRQYTSDINHFFCLSENVHKELIYCLQLLEKIFKIFGFEVQWNLRTKRPHSTLNANDWGYGVKALTDAASALGVTVEIVDAPGALVGPRLEAQFLDALGQAWSGSFIQIDCCHPRLMNIANEAKKHQLNPPKMIAFSLWGSLERFVALLVENDQGVAQWPALLKEVQKKINGLNEESRIPIES